MNTRMKRTRIYAFLLCVIMIIASSSMVYADFKLSSFSYSSYYPGYRYSTSTQKKTDNSVAYAKYTSGSADRMYFEIWASDGTSADAANYTTKHLVNGTYVKYYTAREGYGTYIYNTVYETYQKTVYSKLVTYIMGTGIPCGEWSANTN